MGLSLTDYDELIGHHLHLIEAGAEICESHAKQLFGVPDFETRAAEKLMHVEALLSRALRRVTNARRAMEDKQVVS